MTGEKEVFISWSGPRAKSVAHLLATLIENVMDTDCFVSDRDVESGTWWLDEIRGALGTAKFGVVVLTPENREAPWLMFEAGALMMQHNNRVAPYLVGGMKPDGIRGPLSALQARHGPSETPAELKDPRADTLQLLLDAARSCGKKVERVESRFSPFWERFAAEVIAVQAPTSEPGKERSDGEILREVLALVRASEQRSSSRLPIGQYSISEESLVTLAMLGMGATRSDSLKPSDPGALDRLSAARERLAYAVARLAHMEERDRGRGASSAEGSADED